MVKFLLPTLLVVVAAMVQSNAQVVSMTDDLRRLVLKGHNDLRSTVALGKAVNKDGKTLPKAADMYKLTYSKVVESYAKNNAKLCKYEHDRVNGTSNNLYIWGRSNGFTAPGKYSLFQFVTIF
jgi:hypothetical protein